MWVTAITLDEDNELESVTVMDDTGGDIVSP